MTNPVFFVPVAVLSQVVAGGHVVVSGDEGRHGVAVRRLRAGESVDVVDGAGRRVTGTVSATDAREFTVSVVSITDEPEPPTRLTVVQALAKGDRAESAVEMLTECGVDGIVPWSAQRSVSVWRGERAGKGVARWRAVAAAATKQARRSRVPTVSELFDSERVVELLAGARLGLVLHEEAAARLSRLDLPTGGGEVVVVVGPEGGIAPDELAQFEQVGALAVRLGESVLRTSTAGVAAAAIVMAASGRWD
jgi:16S rRNA (uracil1498-N3)-methyltransferase